MKSLVTSILLLAAMLLTATQSASGKPNKDACDQYKEEQPSKNTAFREFPKFNIKWKLPVNYRSVLLNNGNIMILDNGTYGLLNCLQRNPEAWASRGFFSFQISKAPKKPMEGRQVSKSITDVRFIVNTSNYDYTALRISHAKGDTDISILGEVYNYESSQEDFKIFLSILDDIEVLEGKVNKYE